ncbi:beta-galactosidase [Geminisphaera colitermitum]|uniref:beta-galactosidase n=1 Tax=Geminisphaera colitermitum TaxID=1148786 RepID=UPI000DDAC151|nr:beta-galactosidase [Geminisphaera colitermitum]
MSPQIASFARRCRLVHTLSGALLAIAFASGPLTAIIANAGASELTAATANQLPFANGFPFHIPPTGTQPGTAPYDLAIPPSANTKIDSPISIRGDQFIVRHLTSNTSPDTGEPIRFWGTNLCFSGVFPEHDIADRMAARMATLGINIVRLHHFDQRRFPGGIWHRDAPGASKSPNEDDIAHQTFDPESLDRLDYLIAALKKRGIYTNLNLKVSRIFSPDHDGPDFPKPDPAKNEILPKKGKGFDQFYTPAIAAQKDYARRLLTHRNPYTGLTYTEDPAVAMVEINNENGILWAWNYRILDRIPSRFIDELAARWNTWLRNQYSTTDALRAAWNPASGAGVPPATGTVASRSVPSTGGNLLENIPPALFTAKKARATLAPLTAAADADDSTPASRRLTVAEVPAATAWNVRCNWPLPTALPADATYTATLRLRANQPHKIKLRLRSPSDNKDLAPVRTLNLATEWKNHSTTFAIPPGDAAVAAQLTLEAGIPGLVLDIDSASLQPLTSKNLLGLPAGQGLVSQSGAGGTPAPRPVEWVFRRDLPSRTPAVVTDVMRFLRDTEIAYWREMHAFLRNDLRVAAPITTTAVGYTTPQIAAETADFIDTHRYWGSPRFPAFDRTKPWTVQQKPMVSHPAQSTIERMSARRVFGKPFTITEYNHPPSTDHHAEAFPLVGVWGAAQGWDGLFQFAYSHSRAWEADIMTGFFDTEPNPAHTVAALAASDIFRHRRITPFASTKTGYVTLDRQLERQNNYAFPREIEADAIYGGLPPDAWLTNRVGLAPSDAGVPPATLAPPPSVSQSLVWDAANPATAHVRYTGDGVAGLIGFVSGQTLDLGWLRITPGTTSLNGFSIVMLNTVDRQALGAPGRYLLTVAVRASNLGMGWNADRTGFGKKWGTGPTHAETAPIALDFASATGVRVYPLNPDGTRRPELPPVSLPGRFEATPASKTLWYEIILP